MRAARISEVIKKMQAILESEGDLPVYSVGFHSDYRAVKVEKDNIDDYFEIQDDAYPFDNKKDGKFLLIYGGY